MKARHSKKIPKREHVFSLAAERPVEKSKRFKEKFTEWFRDFLENSE